VRRVVTAQSNQLALRRCYEVAIRGMPEAPAVRLDVEVVVGASGTVTRASAAGNDVGQLKNCVETTVRRWRFPPSSNGGRAQFPVVFSGGG
jgi:outer membrane biosynthesis protein TonB